VDTIYDLSLLTFKETSYKNKMYKLQAEISVLRRDMVAFFDNVAKRATVAVIFKERAKLKFQNKMM
jgi:hypothetical protein